VKGRLGECLGQIKDTAKETITRWFPLTDVQTEDIYKKVAPPPIAIGRGRQRLAVSAAGVDDRSAPAPPRQPFDFWTEKDMRKRRWFPLIVEDIVTTGERPPRGKALPRPASAPPLLRRTCCALAALTAPC